MALRRGSEYLQSLRDDRQVWLLGERVADVTAHPSLAGCARSMADSYDLQHDPTHRGLLTMPSPTTGEPVSAGFLLPRTTEDLARRRQSAEFVLRRSGGVAARLPVHMASLMVGLYDVQDVVADADPAFAANAAQYFEFCQEHDPCIAPGFSEPPRDRSLPRASLEGFRVVERRADGVVVRGAKAVSTLAPYANEFFCPTSHRVGLTPDEVIYFAIPVNTRGIRMLCRQPLAPEGANGHLLSARHDEMDATVIFDDVFVPAERVFYLAGPERNEELFRRIMLWGGYDNLIRVTAKAEVLAGICVAIADYLGTSKVPHVESGICEAIEYVETLRAFVKSAEQEAVRTPSGLLAPHPVQILLGRLHAMERHPAILQLVRELCGSGLLMAPGEAEMASPEVRADIHRFFVGEDHRAPDRFRLLNLAWEYAADSFGGRQLLFEMNNEATLPTNRVRLLNVYDTAPLARLAKSLAGIDEDA